jgi:hypothetical protein
MYAGAFMKLLGWDWVHPLKSHHQTLEDAINPKPIRRHCPLVQSCSANEWPYFVKNGDHHKGFI